MPVENVYQNISNILQRIESIKRRFGVLPPQGQVLSGQGTVEQNVQAQGTTEPEQVYEKQKASASSDLQQVSSDKTSFGETLERKIVEMDGQKPAGIRAEKTSAQTVDSSASAPGVDIYGNIIKTASDRFGIPESLIQAVIKQESGFNNSAVSSKGAMGLMQLMPETANSLGVENPFNPEENILGGTRYLVDLLNQYNGNLNLALAAYNAGPNRVENKIPGISETKDFIDSVLRHYQRYQKFNKEEL